MFENPRRGRQARNFTTNAPKILDLKSSSEQIVSRKLPLGAPENVLKQGAILAPVAKQWIAEDILSYGRQSKRTKIAILWFGKY